MEIDMNEVYKNANVDERWGKWYVEKNLQSKANRSTKLPEDKTEYEVLKRIFALINDEVEERSDLPHIWAQFIDHGDGMTSMEVIGQEGSAGTIKEEKKVCALQELFSEMIKHAVQRSDRDAKKPAATTTENSCEIAKKARVTNTANYMK